MLLGHLHKEVVLHRLTVLDSRRIIEGTSQGTDARGVRAWALAAVQRAHKPCMKASGYLSSSASGMGMCRQTVVGMFADAVMLCACSIERVDVHAHLTKIAHVVEELMADLCGDGMSLGYR